MFKAYIWLAQSAFSISESVDWRVHVQDLSSARLQASQAFSLNFREQEDPEMVLTGIDAASISPSLNRGGGRLGAPDSQL